MLYLGTKRRDCPLPSADLTIMVHLILVLVLLRLCINLKRTFMQSIFCKTAQSERNTSVGTFMEQNSCR